jgi:RNA polymerase sigma factor (TIGR02999 family)
VQHDADLTGLLQAWNAGDAAALDTLTALVHQELRDMARRLLAHENRDRRWQPTELVQESYLRLLDWRSVHWQNRAHFFATAARMMRRVLVDAARHRRALKRGHEFQTTRLPLHRVSISISWRSKTRSRGWRP